MLCVHVFVCVGGGGGYSIFCMQGISICNYASITHAGTHLVRELMEQ